MPQVPSDDPQRKAAAPSLGEQGAELDPEARRKKIAALKVASSVSLQGSPV